MDQSRESLKRMFQLRMRETLGSLHKDQQDLIGTGKILKDGVMIKEDITHSEKLTQRDKIGEMEGLISGFYLELDELVRKHRDEFVEKLNQY